MSTTTKTRILDRLLADGIFETVAAMADRAVELTEEVCAHNYHPIPVVITRGQDAYVWDKDGKRYYDMVGCYSALAHGHLNEEVLSAVRQQIERLTLTSRAVYTSEMAVFLGALCEFCDMEMAVPMNTGVEAVETALKLARKWAYTVKGVPDNQAEIIAASGNFHGRTLSVISFSSEPQYTAHFGPLTPGFRLVEFGDASALEACIGPNTAAVILEPIQAEGGIIIPPDGYLAQVRQICSRHNTLLIWDEIQTGFGRTGQRFAWQWEDAKPDMMTLGKALGAGIMPVSAVVGRREVLRVFQPGDHGSTFGGNPLASIVGLAAIVEMLEGRLDEQSRDKGQYFLTLLKPLEGGKVKEVRGRGLLIGVEIHVSAGKAHDYLPRLLAEGVLTKDTHSQTFRFAPPLEITREELDDVAARIHRALS